MVEIEIIYQGSLRTSCDHGPSSAQLHTDAPVDNHGRGESFSPTDLLATALGACMTTVMGIRAEAEGWSIEGTRVRVEKHMASAPRRVSRLVVEIGLPSSLDEAARTTLERVAWACPVKQSLCPNLELDVRFSYAG